MSNKSSIWSALVHYPVLDKGGANVTTSVTNMDVHDLARSSRTYGLRSFIVVTPIDIHREMVRKVAAYWQEPSCGKRTPSRKEVLGLVAVADSIEAVVAMIEGETGKKPDIIGTTAKSRKGALSYAAKTHPGVQTGGSPPLRRAEMTSPIVREIGHHVGNAGTVL